jgi:hypothetical protein
MQTFGTVLQLSGSVITLGGLVYAWHVASGYLNQLREATRNRWTQLSNSLASFGRQTPPGSVGASLPVTATTTADMTLKRAGTVEERLERLENEPNMSSQLARLTSTLRDEIDTAITAERDESNAIRLKDIYPALFGIVVSMAGLVCQLAG